MAITTVGYDGTVTETQFATLMRYVGEVGYKHGVPTGFTASAGGGTRQVSITTGTAILPGLLAVSDATATATLAANAGSANRVDYVVLQANWTTNTTSVTVVQGSSATPPALTQTEGSLWQMPLARVTVRPGVTTLLSSDIVVCKPLSRTVQAASGSLIAANRAYNSGAFTVSSITMPDPGWPYRVQVSARGRFAGSKSGYGVLSILVNGTQIGSGLTEPLTTAGTHSLGLTSVSGAVSGPTTVQIQVQPLSMSSGDTFQSSADTGVVDVLQIPA